MSVFGANGLPSELSRLRQASDENLMALYQEGERGAFDVLFERHAGRVLGYLLKKLRSRKDADDVLQEVFLKLHRSRSQYDMKLAFAPWLFSITRSSLVDHLRKLKREDATDPAEFDRLEADRVPEPQAIGASETGYAASELLKSLPASQREAVSLRVYDEATFEEIATRLGTSPENARQLVSRGLRKLKGFFTKSVKE